MKAVKKNHKYVLHLAALASFGLVISTAYAAPVTHTCKSLFSDDASPFKAAFYRVNPESFYTMCINLPVNDSDAIARIAASYVHEARRVEVHLRMPSEFLTAHDGD
jgi:hypothetical protein